MYDRDLPSNGGTNDGSHQGEEEEPLHGSKFSPKILLKNKNKKILEGPRFLLFSVLVIHTSREPLS